MSRSCDLSRPRGRTRALMVLLLAGCATAPSSTMRFARPSARLTDEVITRDLARFDSLARAVADGGAGGSGRRMSGTRAVAYVRLARETYERNDDGRLTGALLAAVDDPSARAVVRTRRPDLWTLLDSVRSSAVPAPARDTLALVLEVALLRAQYEVLGAPSCAAWEREGDRTAALLRQFRPALIAAAPSPAATPEAPPASPVAPPGAVLRGVPSLVHFALDRSELSPASRHVLEALVDSLRSFPDVRIAVEGHTDRRASTSYNDALSRRRARTVRAFLVQRGIDPSRIRTAAFGESNLETSDNGVRDHALNRRVLLRYFTADGRELPAVQQLDDLQVERR